MTTTVVRRPRALQTAAVLSLLGRLGRRDPTRTMAIRARFSREVKKRFRALKVDVRTSVVDEDCFGLQPSVLALAAARRKQFAFARTDKKVDEFMLWLEEQERLGVLEIIRRPGGLRGLQEAWTDVYVHSSYAQGIARARAELSRAGYKATSPWGTPSSITAAMNSPIHADRIGVIFSRTFEELKAVTQVMNAQVRRKITEGLTTGLARGMAEGKNPRTIARELVEDVENRVDKIGITRALTIARTEVIRAHHVATIAEYRQADETLRVSVEAEWSSAGDDRVCPDCADLNGRVFSLDAIEGLIPYHPNCRCCAIPYLKKTEEEEE